MTSLRWLWVLVLVSACGGLREVALDDELDAGGSSSGGSDDDGDDDDDQSSSSSGGSSGSSSSSGGSSSGSSSSGDADAGPFVKGELELVASALEGGVGVAVTDEHVYWYEQGEWRGGGSSDSYFMRLPLDELCAPAVNCGALIPRTEFEPYFFGDARTGPVTGEGWSCVTTTYNATRDTELRCLNEATGVVSQLGPTQFAAGVSAIYDGYLYFTVAKRAADGAGAKSSIRRVALDTAATPTVVVSRDADVIDDLAIDATGLVWLEGDFDGDSTTLWQKTAATAPVQLVAARPGRGEVELDADHVFVSRTSEGVVVRYTRNAPVDELVLAINQKSPGPLVRRGDFLFWLNFGPAPDYAASQVQRSRLDGSDVVLLDDDRYLSGIAVTDSYVYAVSFTDTVPGEGRLGSLKRIRWAPP